jgi:hypothetical protein
VHGHLANLELAFTLLREHGREVGTSEVVAAIARRAARAGGQIHRTATVAWCEVIAARMAGVADLGDLLARHPELDDRDLLARYYRSETLASDAAREGWVEPDLRPLTASLALAR